jgi:hypothetical protein
MLDLVLYVQIWMQKEKGHLCNSKKYRSFSVKWERMGGKIKTYEGCFAKVKNLLLNRKYR